MSGSLVRLGKHCPICDKDYFGYSAVSRTDNETPICKECGIRQALESVGVTEKTDQDHILDLIYEYERNGGR